MPILSSSPRTSPKFRHRSTSRLKSSAPWSVAAPSTKLTKRRKHEGFRQPTTRSSVARCRRFLRQPEVFVSREAACGSGSGNRDAVVSDQSGKSAAVSGGVLLPPTAHLGGARRPEFTKLLAK